MHEPDRLPIAGNRTDHYAATIVTSLQFRHNADHCATLIARLPDIRQAAAARAQIILASLIRGKDSIFAGALGLSASRI